MNLALRSVRFQLPALLIVVGAVVYTLSLVLALERTTSTGLASREQAARTAMSAVARILADLSHREEDESVEEAVTQLGAMSDMDGAAFVDADGRVIAGTHAAWVGQPLAATPWADARGLMERLRAQGHPVLDRARDGRTLMAFPVRSGELDARGDVARQSVLLARFDFRPLVADVRRETYRFYLIMGLSSLLAVAVVAAFLHFRVARPALRIARAAERFAAGDRAARVGLEGGDELAMAGRSFDHMARQVETAEGALTRQQRLLDGVLRAIPVGVVAVSRRDRRILFANPQWNELFGLESEAGADHTRALAGLRFFRRDGSPLAFEDLAVPTAARTGEPVDALELMLERPDGTRVPYISSARPVRFEDDADFDTIVGVAHDRRDLAQVFAELQRSERRFQELFDSLPVGILLVERATRRLLFMNQHVEALLGRPRGDAVSLDDLSTRIERPDGSLLAPEDRPLQEAMRTGQPAGAGDMIVVRPDGQRVPVVVSALPVRLGGGPEPDAVVSVLQDRRDLERVFVELRRSERRFSTLLESIPVGVLMVDRASRTVLYANHRLEELGGHPSPVGAPLDRLEGRRVNDAGEHYALERLPIERALAECRSVACDDLVYVHPDGTRVPVVTTVHPMNLLGGPEFDAVVAVVQDRRDLERAFAELRRSERLFSTLLESIPVGVLMVDRATHTVLYANRRLEELCGPPTPPGSGLHQLEGRRLNAAGEPYPIASMPIERALAEGHPVVVDDLTFVHDDGTTVPVLTAAYPMNIGDGPEFDAVVAVVQDRRDLEHAFAELKAWEERFQSVSKVTGQAVYEWDVVRDQCRFSDSITGVFGYTNDEVDTNDKWNAITHPEDLQQVLEAYDVSTRQQRNFDCVYRVRHKDGRWRWVRDRGVLHFDADGRPTLMIGAVDDITEQRELETRFRQAQKMETVGTLAGGIAHDFNNQLTGVLGHLDLLSDEMSSTDTRQEHVRVARLAAERCAELTRGLLAFSRMLRGEPRPVDVNAMLEETAALLRRVLPATIRLELAPAADLPPVLVDPTQLQQVLLNLCVNARDAMPEGGALRIATGTVAIDAEQALDASVAPGAYVRISVADAGMGIAPEVMPRIFEPFFTTKPVGMGTGLGLSMVYGIVSQHHGWVDVESTPGQGSTFRVHLPVMARPAPAAPAGAERSGVAPNYVSRTVMVVDDEPIVRDFAARLLERAGCRVLAAADGHEALELLARNPDAVESVLLDLTMPGPAVRDVVREMRRQAPGLRIVLTSGYSQDATTVPEFAGLAFLPKPYPPSQLLEMMCAETPPPPA